ncbi:MAG TPA: hypothetical protein ENJ56_04740, partial [Anaerolineae bacterium]|nr:hypothetical protein [Anaerolineae bacterium]
DIFVHDRDVDLDGIYDEVGAIRTVRVSVANDGTEGNNKSEQPRMSADGRFIVFQSDATNLVANDPLPCVCSNIFLHDRDSDQDGIFDEPGAITTERISQFAAQATRPRISADGQIITYLLEGDTDIPCLVTQGQIVRFDRSDNSTTCPIRNRTSGTPNGATSGAALSADGQAMVFHSSANNLVGGVTSSGHVYLYQHNGDSAQATVDTYTRVRDELFATSPTGVRYTQLFYQHTGEVVQLALADPAFFQSIRTTMTLWQPTLEALLDPGRAGDTVISAEQINALDTFLTTVSTRGSSELAATIAAERQALPPFNAFIGMTVADAAATVLDAPYQIYLPAIANSAPTRGATQIESPQRNDLCLFICIMLGFCE